MSIPFWDDAPEAWQAVAIDGEVLPGVARIDSVSRPRKIHAAQPGGARGGRVRDRGAKLVKFKVTVRVWTAEQLAQMQALLPLFDYRTEPAPVQRPTRAQATAAANAALVATPLTDDERIQLDEADARDADARSIVRQQDQLSRIGLRPGEGVDSGRVLPATTAASRRQAAREEQQAVAAENATASGNTTTSTTSTTASRRVPPRRVRRAVSIAHPALDLMGINRVFIEGVAFEPPKDSKDTGEFSLECREYVPQVVSTRSRTVTSSASLADITIAPALRPSASGAGAP